jgi:hypothetical protein
MDFQIYVSFDHQGISDDEVLIEYPDSINLNGNQIKEVDIKFTGVKPGKYQGNLYLCADKCYRIPLYVTVKSKIIPVLPPPPSVPGFTLIAAIVSLIVVLKRRKSI